MHSSDIVTRINQISDFFRAYPREEAITGIETHIHDFWDPRMQRDLITEVQSGGKGMNELALEAAKRAVSAQIAIKPAA